MQHEDMINLLKECNAGIKMGVDAIDDVLDSVQSENLKNILDSSKEEHQELGSQIHALLEQYYETGKEPNIIAKGMSWMKTNSKLAMDTSDATIADLITDGCNMGVKSISKYLNKYKAAGDSAKDHARKLISMEEQLAIDIRPYL